MVIAHKGEKPFNNICLLLMMTAASRSEPDTRARGAVREAAGGDRNSAVLRAAGSVTKVQASDRTGPETRPKRTLSATPQRVQNSGAAKFGVLSNDNSIERVISFDQSAQL